MMVCDDVVLLEFTQSFGNAVAEQLTYKTGLYWIAVGEVCWRNWDVTFSSPSLPFQIATGEWKCGADKCGYTYRTAHAAHIMYHIEEFTQRILEYARAKCFDVPFDAICDLWRRWNAFG